MKGMFITENTTYYLYLIFCEITKKNQNNAPRIIGFNLVISKILIMYWE